MMRFSFTLSEEWVLRLRNLFVLLITSVVFGSAAIETFGQTTWFRRASTSFNVSVESGVCANDKKCGRIIVNIFRKGSKALVQEISGGRIFKSDIAQSVQFFDINFDGSKDLLLFDGFTAPGGNITYSWRIYLYSKKTRTFIFNEAFSSLSREEGLDLESSDRNRKSIITSARPGSGVFQWRTYMTNTGRPVLIEEIISDSQIDNGTRTLVTTKKLIKGRWRVWTKHKKTIMNQ